MTTKETREKKIIDEFSLWGCEVLSEEPKASEKIEFNYNCGCVGSKKLSALRKVSKQEDGTLKCKECIEKDYLNKLIDGHLEIGNKTITKACDLRKVDTIEVKLSCGHFANFKYAAYVENLKDKRAKCRSCSKKKEGETAHEKRARERRERKISKTNTDELKLIAKFKKLGCKVLSENPKASEKVKIIYACGCEGEVYPSNMDKIEEYSDRGYVCKNCAQLTPPTELIQRHLEIGNKTLTHPDKIKVGGRVLVEFSCGHESEINYKNYLRNLREERVLCKSCSNIASAPSADDLESSTNYREEMQRRIEILEAEVIGEVPKSTERIKVKFACGHIGEAMHGSINRQYEKYPTLLCPKCSHLRGHPGTTAEEWTAKAIEVGFTDVDIKTNVDTDRISARGTCGHKIDITLASFRGRLRKKKTKCEECAFDNGRSSMEMDFFNELEEVCDTELVHNKKVPISKNFVPEIDIFFPEHNFGIEFNGVYWHSELIKGKEAKRHMIKKTKIMNSIGIRLIHVNEDEYVNQKEIIMSMIKQRLGLVDRKMFARKLEVKKITPEETNAFYDVNHMQGGKRCGNMSYGLFDGQELISAMSWKSTNKTKSEGEIELYRFATKLNHLVVGGFSKLLKHFERVSTKYSRIKTYADLRFTSIEKGENVYEKNGFTLSHHSNPNYKYFKPNSLEMLTRQQFMKHKLKDKLKTFNPDLTEWENMKANGYNRIWDCGNLVLYKAVP